jgi:hypothetical protein
MPPLNSHHDTMMAAFESMPRGLAVLVAILGLVYLFSASFIGRGLVLLNIGAIGGVLGYQLAGSVSTNALVTCITGALVCMAIGYSTPRPTAAIISFVVVGFAIGDLCIVFKLSNSMALFAGGFAAIAAAGITFVMLAHAVALALSLQGSYMLMASSFMLASVLGFETLPFYGMIKTHTIGLPLCILIPAAIGFFVQMAFHDPTKKEKST